jgi:ribosomal-protein-alanine N-acetyltransferase
MLTPVIETERLKLLPFDQLQATQLHTLWTQPEVRRYLWDDESISGARTAEILQRNDVLFAREGFGLWSISQRAAPGIDTVLYRIQR